MINLLKLLTGLWLCKIICLFLRNIHRSIRNKGPWYIYKTHPVVQNLCVCKLHIRKGSGTRDQIASIHWIIEKAREFQKNIYCFIDYAKALGCVDHNKLWKILKDMEILDHLTCLLRNLYAGQAVRTRHGTTDWFQIGKGVHQACSLSRCLFNLYAEYIRRNARLDEAQAGIKIAGRIINNLFRQMTPLLWQKTKRN